MSTLPELKCPVFSIKLCLLFDNRCSASQFIFFYRKISFKEILSNSACRRLERLTIYWIFLHQLKCQIKFKLKTKNATHNMVYLYDACDQISDFCHQQLLRKMRRKLSWTDGRTDRWTEVKQYTPLPLRGAGV